MIKDTFFSLPRFMNLCRKEMVESWRSNVLRMALMYGVMDDSRVLLDESTSNICDKLFFVESDNRELAKNALFAIPTIQGNYLILPNEEQEESELNLELLFNATLAAPEEIARLFHTQK